MSQGQIQGVPGMGRRQRHEALQARLRGNPFLTDEELAALFGVSVQTVRLDRLALGIPELRERTREVARRAYGVVRTMAHRELVGDLVDIDLGRRGVSILDTTEAMAFERSGIIRGHYLFAQAESLAMAVIDAPVARTGVANAKFKRPVHVGERLVAKAEVLRTPAENEFVVLVVTRSGDEPVFRAKYLAVAGEGVVRCRQAGERVTGGGHANLAGEGEGAH